MCFFQQIQPIRILILLLTAVLPAILNGCGNDSADFRELVGTWITDEKQYENRYIEINKKLLIFGTGSETPNLFFIETARKKEKNGIREYSFHCQNAEETEFSFIFTVEDSNDRPVFRMKNPNQVVWEKISEEENDCWFCPDIAPGNTG